MVNQRLFNNFWVKLDKFLGVIAVTSIFCLIFVIAHRAIFDLDIWLHLKTGEFILQSRNIPAYDIFSFTLQGKPWIDHEWLFQVISYLIYNKWQAEGLISLQCYIILLSFFVLFLMGYKKIKSYLEVAVFLFMVVYVYSIRFNIRPDIFSMLFFALYLYLLRFQIDKKIIWLLLVIQILWVNLHGYFFLGPLVTFLFIAAEFLRRKIKFLPWQWREEFTLNDVVYKRLKKVFSFIVIVCIFNPRGFKGALYPFSVFKEILLGRTQIFFKYIQELQPTFQMYSYSRNFYYLIILFCFSLIVINFKRLKLVEIFLVSFFFLFSFTSRNVAFFAFVGYMIIISYIGPTLRGISANIKLKTTKRETLYFLLKYGLTVFFIVWIGLRVDKILHDSYYDFQGKKFISLLSGIEQRRYPKGAVDFVLSNNIEANLFNDFNSGAYLIGRAYPKRKVFIDGRTELYGSEFFKQYQAVTEGEVEAIETTINKYNISAILLSLTSRSVPPVIKYLYTNPQWKIVFFDESGLVFLKDSPTNKDLIDKYRIDFKKYQLPIADLHILGLRSAYPLPYIQRASLFNLLHEDALVIKESKEALRIMPNCAQAYHLLGKAYLHQGLYQEALENLRATLLLTPRNVEALVDLGACLKELKDSRAAISALKGAIRFNQHYAPAYYTLGCVYLMIDNDTQAMPVLNKAIKYAPFQPQYHFKLGEALFELGKKSKDRIYIIKARDELKKASQLNRGPDLDLARDIQGKLEEIKITFPQVK